MRAQIKAMNKTPDALITTIRRQKRCLQFFILQEWLAVKGFRFLKGYPRRGEKKKRVTNTIQKTMSPFKRHAVAIGALNFYPGTLLFPRPGRTEWVSAATALPYRTSTGGPGHSAGGQV